MLIKKNAKYTIIGRSDNWCIPNSYRHFGEMYVIMVNETSIKNCLVSFVATRYMFLLEN